MNESTEMFGKYRDKAKSLINSYYDAIANLDISMLKYMYGEYFNYDYSDRPDGIKLCPVKDGCVLWKGECFVRDFTKPIDDMADGVLYRAMYPELMRAVGDYEKICSGFEEICAECDESLKTHIRAKWLNYAYTQKCLYEWYVSAYEAKCAYDEGDVKGFVKSLEKACASLEFNLEFRKNAEYGDFENWYRGEILSDVKRLLHATNRLLGRA